MAEDVIVLLDYLGWKEERSVHAVGISLGGMIAQGMREVHALPSIVSEVNISSELAARIPDRLTSLTLAVTTPGGRPWNNLPSVRMLFYYPRIRLNRRTNSGRAFYL